MVYAEDAALWKTDLAPTGTLRAWLESGKTTAVGSWVSEEVMHTVAFQIDIFTYEH